MADTPNEKHSLPSAPPLIPPRPVQVVGVAVPVQIADKISDSVGVLVIGYLAMHHVVDGVFAVVTICALLGVNTGLRQAGSRFLGGTGAVGLGVFGLIGASLVGSSMARAGLAGLAGAARVSGHALLPLVVMLAGMRN